MIQIDDAWRCMRCKELWMRHYMQYMGRHGLLCPECAQKVKE